MDTSSITKKMSVALTKTVYLTYFFIYTGNLNSYATEKIQYYNQEATRLNEIVEFKDLPGGGYALGYGYDKFSTNLIPLAVYDKTFRGPFDTEFWQILALATIGINDLNLNSLKNSLSSRGKKKSVVATYLKTLMLNKDAKLGDGIYPKDWWKNPEIPWKKKYKPAPNLPAPKRIPLKWIDFNSRGKNKKHIEKLHKIYDNLRKKNVHKLRLQ